MGEENPIRTLRDYSRPSHKGYRNTIELPEGNNMIDHTLKQTVDYAAGGQLRKISAEKAWAAIEELARYGDVGWNDLVIEAISLMERSESVFGMTSNTMYQLPSEPSQQEEFEDLTMNFKLDQEERIKQLENYMQDITNKFMEFSFEVTLRLKENESKTQKIRKITRVTVQQVQERQGQSYAGTGYKGNATTSKGNNAGGRRMLAEARESGQILDEDKLAFLIDSSIPDGQAAQITIPNNAKPTKKHLEALKRVFRYLKGTINQGLWYPKDTAMALTAYVDADHADFGYQNPFYLKKAQRIKPILYDGSVISSQHAVNHVIHEEETLILEKISRSKMLAKQKDPILKEKKINTTPINYVELNRLTEDFSKRFVTQQELSAEQAFWLQTLHHNIDQSDISPVKIEAPMELPKEHCDSLIAQLNSKSMENMNLTGQIQEKVFVTTTLQNELRILKGKNVLDNATTITNATNIASGMFKLDLDPLAPRTDNGTGFVNQTLREFYENVNISHQTSVARTL
nr:uncharacterized mitochondrial protein AtMg00810-like [Tanacetum cinerariifolium]